MKDKSQYVRRVKEALAHNYYAVLSTKELSGGLRQRLLKNLKLKKYTVLFYRQKILRKLFSSTFKKPVNGDLIVFSNQLEPLIEDIVQNKVSEKVFLKQNELSSEDIVLQKGPLRVKAGVALSIFEPVANLKITKGFIDLLEPLILTQTNTFVSATAAKILLLLAMKTKLKKTSLVSLYDLRKKRDFSEDFISVVENSHLLVGKIATLMSTLQKCYPVTPVSFLAQRLAKILLVLKQTK